MRKIVLFLMVTVILGSSVFSYAAQKQMKYLSQSETMEYLKKAGVPTEKMTYEKSSDTDTKQWKVHLFSMQQDDSSKMPLITYVNDREVVVGLLMRDGKIVMPGVKKAEMLPKFDLSKNKLTTVNRHVYNAAKGKEIIYVFTDPDCPYCIELDKKLPEYTGKYKIIVKNFPLTMHSNAKERAIERQCRWIQKDCDIKTKELATNIVNEDMADGKKIGVSGTPFYVGGDGQVLTGIPDLQK